MDVFMVYMHRNIINGKVYIGMTCRAERRWKPYSYTKCPAFYNAIKKYGWENFEHIILADNLSKEDAQRIEVEKIQEYHSQDHEYGYNIARVGACNMLGYRFTDEQKHMLSQQRKGKGKGEHVSPSTEFKQGHVFSEESLQKMRDAKLGKTPWNKGLIGYKSGEENSMKKPEVAAKFKGSKNPMSRAVAQYTLDGELIREWSYMTAIYEEYGWHVSNIIKCCRNKTKSAYGYTWKYMDKVQKESA